MINKFDIVSGKRRYLVITGPNNFYRSEFKNIRREANELLVINDLCLVMHDLRDADIDSAQLICIDDIAMSSRIEMPDCIKLAIICSPSPLMDHYLLVNSCTNGVDLRMFDSTDAGEKWLLN